ncbi:MAG: hypothetical protein II930_02370, partial [Lachnospiraceae bacterium]|nr:hypothetical protein [Lachnospiraceae bacterium]
FKQERNFERSEKDVRPTVSVATKVIIQPGKLAYVGLPFWHPMAHICNQFTKGRLHEFFSSELSVSGSAE